MGTFTHLLAEVTKLLDGAFDRNTRAINDARSGTYTSGQLYEDSANAFLDGVYGTLLPVIEFLPFEVTRLPPFPVAEFELTTAVDEITAIPLIDPAQVTKVAVDDLLMTGKPAQKIAAKHVDLVIAGNDLVVKIKGSGVPATSPGTYEGDIVGENPSPKHPIGKVRVRWFVV